MVQGTWNRREVHTRRVEYVIETPYGQPIEAKTLGVVLARVNNELGDRAQYDNAYHIRGENERVIVSFEVETVDPDPGYVIHGDPMPVLVTAGKGGAPMHTLHGSMRFRPGGAQLNDSFAVEVLADEVEAANGRPPVGGQAMVLIRNREGGDNFSIAGSITEVSEHGLTVEIPAEQVGKAARSLGMAAEVPTHR